MSERKEKRVLNLGEIQPEPIQWLWPGRLAAGKLTLIDGDPGQGKSLMTLDLAARITTGREFPDGVPCGEPGSVVLVGSEDGVSDTIISRLRAAQADLSRVHIFDGTWHAGAWQGPPSFPEDCRLLQEIVQETRARLVIIDPLLAFISSTLSSVNDQMVRRALVPLAQVAETARAAMTMVRHLNKWGGGQRAVYRGSGSIGIIGSARTAFLVARDPEETEVRVLACTKNNLGAPPPSLGFRIVQDTEARPRIEWAGTVDVSADELVLAPGRIRGQVLSRAAMILEKLLSKGPCTYETVYRKTRGSGISERTLSRAKAELRVTSKQVYENGHSVWYWSLPDAGNAEASPDYPLNGQALPATEEQLRNLDLVLQN